MESCVCDGHTRAMSQSFLNKTRQIDMNWSRVGHEVGLFGGSCICDSGMITVSL